MPSPTTYAIGLQGAFGILNGAASILVPSVALKHCQRLNVDSVPAIHTIALGSISTGIFYMITAMRKDTAVHWLIVLGKASAMAVFSYHGGPWSSVAVFEGVCAIVVAAAMGWERWTGTEQVRDGKKDR